MDFELVADVENLRAKVKNFVDSRIIPLESDPGSYDAHENIAPALLERMRAELQSGDWLHPNDAGYRVMGDAVDLTLFR